MLQECVWTTDGERHIPDPQHPLVWVHTRPHWEPGKESKIDVHEESMTFVVNGLQVDQMI